MQKSLLAGVLLSLCGSAFAQSTPVFQSGPGGNPNQAASELFFMVEQLRDEVRNLRGTVEEQQHRIEQLSKQSRDRYVDLDGRLLELSGRVSELEDGKASATGGSGGAETARTSGSAADRTGPARETVSFRPPNNFEQKTYNAIQEKIRAKKYTAAIDDLYQFISDYPEGDLTVNAYYWLGEVYLAQSELAQARQAFTIVTARFPSHRKAADALYKVGIVHDRQDEKDKARSTMKSVLNEYPRSNAAGLAKSYLDKNSR